MALNKVHLNRVGHCIDPGNPSIIISVQSCMSSFG